MTGLFLNFKIKVWIIVGVLCLQGNNLLAQDRVSLRDATEIDYQARSAIVGIVGLKSLLNYVTSTNSYASEIDIATKNSYKTSDNQLFVDEGVVIEDDINPDYSSVNSKDLFINKYLDALDIGYEKTDANSIDFANINVSKLKKKEYLYVKVRFEEKFSSTYKATGKPYPVRFREAQIRLSNRGANGWQALIVGLSFYDPATSLDESSEDDVEITTDASAGATVEVVSREDFIKQRDDFVLTKQQEEKKKQADFDRYVTLAETYISDKRYNDALELLYNAKKIKSLVPLLDKRILDTKKLASEYTFESLKSRADQAKNEHRYSDAMRNYQEALSIKTGADASVESEIAFLTKKLREISLPKNKLNSGDYQGAIDACDNIIKENKKSKNEFPELYYLKGQAYEMMAAKQPGDTKVLDHALENYSLAIQYFPNYVSALLSRAAFYIKYKHDFVKATTDYDIVTENTLDSSPEKPKYLVTKAEWKDQSKDYSGALEDYAKAIVLSPEFVKPRFKMGELLYRQNRYAEALASLSSVIKLDSKNSPAYYYRGLSYIGLNDAPSAGADFGIAEKLGLEPAQLQKVEAVSNSYFEEGQKAFDTKQLAKADTLYNHAISVRPCNSQAWHGKAEIRFVTAEGQAKNILSPTYKDSYQQAVDLYQKALGCNPKYSDASYKIGEAYQRTAQYPLALKAYTDAIKSDANNVQAFMSRGRTNMAVKQYADAITDHSRSAMLLQANLVAAKKVNQKEVVTATNEELSEVYQLTSQSWYNKSDFAKSILMADKALELDEKNAEALYYKGLSSEALHDVSKALKCYTDAIKYAPQSKYYYANGKALLGVEKYEQAISNLSQTIKLDTLPVMKDARYLRGLSYFRSHLLEDAYKDFAVYAKAGGSSDGVFYTDFGVLNLYLNHDAAAIEDFQRALTLKPNYAQALYGLGCAYAKAGEFEPALKQFELAFQNRRLKKDDIKQQEESFLGELNKVKAHKTKYNQLKKTYLLAPSPTSSSASASN